MTGSDFSVHTQVCTDGTLMKTTIVGIFERPHIDYVVLVIRLSEFGLSCSRIDKIISMIMNIVGVLIKVVL